MKKSIPIAVLAAALMTFGSVHAANLGINSAASLGIHAEGNASGEDGQNVNAQGQASVKANLETKEQDRGTREIDRRITALNRLETRISSMNRVSSDEQSSLHASITNQITALTALKAKLAADTDATAIKDDVASITKSYRIFALILPKGAITAAADRISVTADLMATFGAKLQTRINEAATAGHSVTALQSAYSDYTAKIADAKTQASAAITLLNTLTVDNGVQANIDSNKQALTDAHAKMKAGRTDLQAARADAVTIIKQLKDWSVQANTQTETSAGTQTPE